jgi:hypothetical protein
MSASPAFVATPANPAVAFANADGTSFKTLMTPAASGSRLDTLIASSTDSASNVLQLAVQISGVDYVIGEVTIPANAGTNGSVKSVACLNSTDIPGLAYTEGGAIFLKTGSVLRARMKTAVAGAFAVHLLGIGGDYS